eukprot:6939652-Pyramimonas_sp.AAC.1
MSQLVISISRASRDLREGECLSRRWWSSPARRGRGSLIDYVVASEDIARYARVAKYTPSP